MSWVSEKVNNEQIVLLKAKLSKFKIKSNNEYIDYLYDYKDSKISLYKSKKLVIQGKNAEEIFNEIFNLKIVKNEVINKKTISLKTNFIGCDEVGVGDFFGGISACACFVENKKIPYLKSLNIKDSKLLTDQKMKEIFNKIKNEIPYEVINIYPKEYNQLFNKFKNSHIIKAYAHNECLIKLTKRITQDYSIILDKFVNEKKYYEYFEIINKKAIKIDVFETKAESKYLAVALASIIARVTFLKQISDLKQLAKADLLFAKYLGVNENVKIEATRIYKNKKLNLNDFCKEHFKTFEEIKNRK